MLAALGFKTTEKIVSESIYWQRVDPRTVFNQSLFIEGSAADATQKLIDELINGDEYWDDSSTTNKTRKLKQFFLPWDYWKKITEE